MLARLLKKKKKLIFIQPRNKIKQIIVVDCQNFNEIFEKYQLYSTIDF